ncbi:MAG: T9SS type A sorting domain-containing protein [Ignavibacteria bacterium]|nr:T9SS type A sorting domain-containing protein [Ignavibacteria bacterium]
MKAKLLCFSLLLVLAYSSAISQPVFYHWNPASSPTTQNLNHIISSPAVLGFGSGGICVTTTNAGYNWSIIQTGTTQNINTAYVTGTVIFAAGNNGTIIRSSNSGVSWNLVSFPLTKNIFGITSFIAPNYFLTCGQDGFIYFTSNLGTNWTQINSNSTNNLRSIFYSTSLTSYRAFACGDNGTILKMFVTFPPVPPTVTSTFLNTGFTNNFNSITILSDSTVIMAVGSGGIIIKSTNGGSNWTQQQSGTANTLKQIYRISSTDIWICGDNGTILRTTNGGTNWISQTVNSNANVNSLTYSGITRGIAVGSAGTILTTEFPPPNTDSTLKQAVLEGNNIRAYFLSNGVFNQNPNIQNTPGFEWPKNSGHNAIFTTGLSISAYYNGALRQASAYYLGEYFPGLTTNEVPQSPTVLRRVYKVKQGDNCYNSVDWANWGVVVPYGAPYYDVNNNSVYDPCIDTPGVRNASQTIFMALTDGFVSKHSAGGGFGGTTLPLYADLRITAWCYTDSILKDAQFVKFDVINKSNLYWDSIYFSLACDPDLGDPMDDYIGCDSTRNLFYVYNSDNEDFIYGTSPPAVGFRILKFPLNRSVAPYDTIKSSAFNRGLNAAIAPPPCEYEPVGNASGAYKFAKGFKLDYSPWMSPVFTPPRQVKFIYGGDPYTDEGWLESKGCVQNCGGTVGTIIDSNSPGDRKFYFHFGKGNFRMAPGESNSIVMIQFAARGNSNLNSVTRLKLLSDAIANFYQTVGIKPVSTAIPEIFSLEQNYPNPFNAVTSIKFSVPLSHTHLVTLSPCHLVSLKVFDLLGREVATLINENLQSGTYEVTFDAGELPSGIYFYRLSTNNFSETKKLVLLK